MPRRDGTGPAGQGPLTGRGLGNCIGTRNTVYNGGRGLGLGGGRRMGMARGFGSYYAPEPVVYVSEKDFLTAQMEDLKNRMEIINSQLENLVRDSK